MPDGTRFRFGKFELDPLAQELTRDGAQIPLQSHPFKVLLTLLLRPRAIVPRADLVDAIWPPGTFVDSEHGLNTAIRKLRRALGESKERPDLLETVPRRGYRLAADVDLVEALDRPSIVILPLDDLSPAADHAYLAEGLAEELGRALATISGLTIAPPSAAFRLRGEMPERAALRVGVRYAIGGSLRVDGEHCRIVCRLVDAASRREVWSGRFDRQLRELLALEEEIASEVARSTIEKLLPGGAELPPLDRPTESSAAHDLYLRARSAWRLRGHSILRAISLLEHALDLDRDYVPALQALAACHYSAAAGGHLPSREAARRLAAAARHAVRRAPRDSASCLVEGMRLEWVERSPRRAAACYRRGISRAPRETLGYGWLALLLAASGRFDDALATARRGHTVDPGDPPAAAYLGWTLFFARRFDEALAVFRPAPEFAVAWIARGWIFERLGRLDDALEAIDHAVASNETRFARRERIRILAAMGREKESREAFVAALESGGLFPPFERGLLALARGDRARAVEELAIARDELSPWMRFWRVDPRLDEVRDALPSRRLKGASRPRS